MGVVSLGETKCSGVPCETQEDARQSAAATMNSSLTVSQRGALEQLHTQF